ncbi:hypothetical protein IWW48_001331 [Coemansia sp. RSA 1200]|nr:hypothetical protein IWW48_001331 [Coemansia sp. RSA 1200]
MYKHITATQENASEATAPLPPPTPGIPVERHPSNDDWGTTFVAILLMSLIIFVVLGILVQRSFRLVPTGVMALRTLVGNRIDNNQYHRLENEDDEDVESGVGSTEEHTRRGTGGEGLVNDMRSSDEHDQQSRLELLSDSDMDDYLGDFPTEGNETRASNSDARVINIRTLGNGQE